MERARHVSLRSKRREIKVSGNGCTAMAEEFSTILSLRKTTIDNSEEGGWRLEDFRKFRARRWQKDKERRLLLTKTEEARDLIEKRIWKSREMERYTEIEKEEEKRERKRERGGEGETGNRRERERERERERGRDRKSVRG